MTNIAETHTAEQRPVVLANNRQGNRKAPAARYSGRRLPGIDRLITKASDPCFANHRSALEMDSGLRYLCNQRNCAVRRPKLQPKPYNPMSPTQVPTNVATRPSTGSRRPA